MPQPDGRLVNLDMQMVVPPELRLHVKALAALATLFNVLLPEQLQGDMRLGQFPHAHSRSRAS